MTEGQNAVSRDARRSGGAAPAPARRRCERSEAIQRRHGRRCRATWIASLRPW